MRKFLTFVVVLLGFSSLENTVCGQVTSNGSNVITTAVPFLTIAPESRGGAMGDAGVAISPDVNSLYWNPAKYAFIESDAGVSLSYTPWMRKLIGDMNLAYLVGYRRLDDQQTISGGMRYFSLGQITFRNDAGESQGMQNPNEYAIDFGYTRLLSERFSGSVALRYIHSDLGTSMTGTETLRPGNAFAADVAFYYQQELKSDRYKNILSAGVNISNIGSKISYGDGTKYFIPTNFRLGAAYSSEIDQNNKFTVSMDFNKLLVPTPKPVSLDQGSSVIVGGNTSDKSVIGGIFSSFTDAPGGLKEELQEITVGVGGEYLYNGQFALRGGYFYENQNKGNRKYFTTGAGVKMNAFSLDFSYLIPTQQNHPLENTLRFSLSFDIGQLANVTGLTKSHK